MNENQIQMATILVSAVREFNGMDSGERKEEKGKLLLKEILTAGRTAAFFGGYDGMKQLHDAVEELVGNDNSIGYYLNYMWDGIGGWRA